MCIICESKNLSNITYIDCKGCSNVVEIPTILSATHINCANCKNLQIIRSQPNLTILECEYCPKLRQFENFPLLVDLYCSYCPKLERIPRYDHLKTLNCDGCDGLKYMGDMPQFTGYSWYDNARWKTVAMENLGPYISDQNLLPMFRDYMSFKSKNKKSPKIKMYVYVNDIARTVHEGKNGRFYYVKDGHRVYTTKDPEFGEKPSRSVSRDGMECLRGVRKDGQCKEKPGRKRSRPCEYGEKINGSCKAKPGRRRSR